MDKDFQFPEEVSRTIIRKCQPQLVELLHTDPVIDHLYAEEAITEDQLDKYEDKKETLTNQQDLNRWFLRNVVIIKGNGKLSQQLIKAVWITRDKVKQHGELVELIREKFSATQPTVSMETNTTTTTGPNQLVVVETEPQSTDTQSSVTMETGSSTVNTSLPDQSSQPVVNISSTMESTPPTVTMDTNPPKSPFISRSCDSTSRGGGTPGDKSLDITGDITGDINSDIKYNTIVNQLVIPATLLPVSGDHVMQEEDNVIPKTRCSPTSFKFTMPEDKTVRGYQKELANTGCQGLNYVACAPTGTGKTLIAAMVIASHLEKNPSGKVLFLVNKIPLAEQQYKEVKRYIPELQAQFVTGDCGVHLLPKQLLHDNHMIVCTAGVFLNEVNMAPMSSADRLSLPDVTLIIIDECHNAKKNSPYAMIMEEYIKMKIKGDITLPQVMGLTASPGAGENPKGEVDKTLDHLINLCALLDAQGGIKIVRENVTELVHYSNQPDFDLLKTESRSNSEQFLILLHATMKSLEAWVDQAIAAKCPHHPQLQAYENWIVEQRRLSEQREGPIERDLRTVLTHLQCYYNALKMYHDLNQQDAIAILEEKIQKERIELSNKATKIEKELQAKFQAFIQNASQIQCPVENPKLERLKQLLEEQYTNSNTRGIVFVTTKDTAQRMCHWLQGIPQLRHVIKPGVVTGQSKEDVGGMTQAKQHDAIEQFRTGHLNLLVATTVLEEGLDVPACNLVVRYNHVTNEIARVQAQGRARAYYSRCFAIMEVSSPKLLQELQNKEKGDLAMQALEFLPSGYKLNQDIAAKQDQLIKDRERQKQLQRDSKVVDGDDVRLVCKHCDAFICNGTDLRVMAESHHVVINEDIYTRCVLKGPKEPLPKGDIELGQKVHCKECGQEWGMIIRWPHKGVHFPAIKCQYARFCTPNGKRAFKQWKIVPFIIEKYQ